MKRFRRLTWWLQRRHREATLHDELEFHVAEEREQRRAEGMPDEDAAWAARRDLGNVTMLREDARRWWTWIWLEQLVQDLRFAVRTMRRSPTFTAMAMLTLALGIGANTAIFSFMDALLLRSLPVSDPDSLVVLTWRSRPFEPRGGATFVLRGINGSTFRENSEITARIFPFPAFERLHQAALPVASSLFAHFKGEPLHIVTDGEAEVAQGEYVSGDFFSGLGATPAAGRPLVNDDDRPNAAPVAVVSMGFANRRFGDPASAVGQPIRINNVPFTIVGVAPAEFVGVDPAIAPVVYLPLHTRDVSPDANFYWLEMMARVRPGVDVAQAQATLATVFDQWVATTATNDAQRQNLPRLRLESGAGGLDTLRRRYSTPLNVLMGMVGLILAIACANIANLLLARASARRREIAVRLSIGAGRGRILRQLLTESVCLACISGALSVPIAFASMQVLSTLLANGQESFTLHAVLNWHVLVVTLGLSLLSAVVFGLAPALQSTRPSVLPALKQALVGEAITHAAARTMRVPLMRTLVVAQFVISVLLLVAAGLFVRTLMNLQSVHLGFNPDGLLLFDVNAQQAGYGKEDIAGFYADLRRRLAEVPGVRDVTLSRHSLVRAGFSLRLIVDGHEVDGSRLMAVGPSFLRTMGIPLVEGREIDERDRPGRQMVAVVNELFARTYFGRGNPIGRHFSVGGGPQIPKPGERFAQPTLLDVEIVGVATMARYGALRSQTPPVAYLPYGDISFPPIAQMTYALRTTGDPLAIAGIVRDLVRRADPQLPVTNVRTQTIEINRTINQEIIFARLCSAFALLALVIACVGLYGTMSYAVAQRTTEIGIRMALGARSGIVAWMFLRDVCALAALGLAISLPIALATSRLVRAFLFDIQPNDPYALTAAVIVMLAAALAAAYWPARRATRISPMNALRAG
jgi:predicted permease